MAGRQPRLLLINPNTQDLGWVRRFQLPPLSLMQIAAATPPTWEVRLADETFEPVPSGRGFDLVGITAMTHQAHRAYELADRFRAERVPVVLGGIHPTVLPHEAETHADAVVVGEGEPVWARVLADALQGNLASRYEAPEPRGDVLLLPPPRRELLEGKRYLTRQVLQATRGCPYDCPFCTVTPYFGRRFRYRPAADVLEEIRSFEKKLVVFLDDNIMADPARSSPLLEGLSGTGKRWASQTTLKFGEDRDLLALAARSGCLGVFVGVEGVSGQGSRLAKVRMHSPRTDVVKRIQDAGILVELSLIFGFDDQDESVFEEAVRFVQECAPCAATFHILTPYPGTAFFRQFVAEGRLLHRDWRLYNNAEVVFRPRLMSAERLYRGWVWARKEVHSWISILGRVGANRHHRFASLAYNLLRKAPNDALDPAGWKAADKEFLEILPPRSSCLE